ncbi:XkdX family protein [Limosilactobacillus vaginalis]|uniref:XkdX family protein n=1 Tax=Limosilactobacillus vaginalis TaxID=1633 RepID=A0ABT4K6K4_9LACO|nr:XkdX family protein [Limosilactobacillus vaginalis]MCZ3746578.1 XkdX family protein [Limosilactobacillus vaginalis]MCZ3751530.1 XkdX family protein [Limosilactobacillus vaginalis]MCZ3753217.1 XkdX family protein [Limosilactobacillus vaginalis]MCZ3755097.1 XkdX family protein [Limosilactobacillus vaginalis]MCZ3756702.1 XkdX family protein [Limosilactobacillus vaginalis]
MFEIYLSYYQMGLFTADDIALFVRAKDLTQEQADQILKPTAQV